MSANLNELTVTAVPCIFKIGVKERPLPKGFQSNLDAMMHVTKANVSALASRDTV
jgi:hypothetical protein